MPYRRGRRRRSRGGITRTSRAIATYGKNFGTLPRYWPPSEAVAHYEADYQLRMDTKATAFPNTLTKFQAFSFGGSLDGTDIRHFVTGSTTAGTATNPAAQVLRNWVKQSADYERMAVISSTYKVSWSTLAPLAHGFKAYIWISDDDWKDKPIPALEDLAPVTTNAGWGLDHTAMLNALRTGARSMYRIIPSRLTGDGSRETLTMNITVDHAKNRTGLYGGVLKADTVTNHQSGVPARRNSTVAAGLTFDPGWKQRINVIIAPDNPGTTTSLQIAFFTEMHVQLHYKVLLYDRIDDKPLAP